ncbi:metallophosphoesterase family protein [Natronoarchaeum rubrum]|uniref:metallophosphoesterase family protein n=1 Tax=Natronoarchaeum rubrum TaxID=755311 RepID=UPI002112E438|nr:YfcE family phosphodiesterase [Natronoarchaeum rubrum]
MTTVAIVSDTHVPSRAGAVPEWVREAVASADRVIHAGDFDSRDAYEAVRDMAGGDLVAVRGNMDPLALDLPETASLTVESVEFVVTHGDGHTGSYRDRVLQTVRREADDPDSTVGVSGHTHELHDEVVDGIRLLNPGSATGAAPAASASMLVAEVAGGELSVAVREG